MTDAAVEANSLVTVQSTGPALSSTSDAPIAEQRDTTIETKPQADKADPAPKEPTVDEIIADPAEIDPRKLRKSALQERFGELTTKQKEALKRAETAEAEIARRDKEVADARAAEERKQADAPRPKRENYDNPDTYDEALLAWARNQGKREGTTEAERAQQRATEEKSQRETYGAYETRVAEFSADVTDYADVTSADDLQISPAMAQTIIRDENGPAVAYHLGKNPAEAARIAALPPAVQLFEMGKLSAKVAKPQAQVSRAPAPISRIRSNGPAVSGNVENMSGDEYFAHRMAQRSAAH